jgi:transcriptional regulator with XRE-family HTH domain
MNMEVGALVKRSRKRHGISQQSLALRAGTDQAAVSRIERGEVSPSFETVERLLAAMGEQLEVDVGRIPGNHDPVHLRASMDRNPEERLKLAISWNRLAGQLSEAGRRARAG